MAEFFKKMFDPPVDEINFDSFTKFPLLLFRLMFFKFEPLSINSSVKEKLVQFLRIGYFYLIVSQVMAVMIPFMFSYVFHHSDDFVDASSAIPNIMSMILVAVKALVTLLRKKDIWELFEELKEMFQSQTERDKKNVKTYLDKYNRPMKIFAGPYAIMLLQITYPIVVYFATGKMILAVKYQFPFDIFRPVVFPLTNLWIIWVGFNVIVLMLATDALFFSLATFLSMELSEVNMDVMNLKFIDENKKHETLNRLIDRHNKLLDLCDKFQRIFGLIFFASFTINALNLCFIAFQLSIGGDFASYSFFITYMCLIGGQTYLLCNFGQKVIDSSELIAHGVFTCGWEDGIDNVIRRKLILMMLRAQRPKKLSALSFADVSLVNFAYVSYFTYFEFKNFYIYAFSRS